MRNALLAAFTGTDLESERLAPHARYDFKTLISAWTVGINQWCDRILPPDREVA
jgi:hypothetical protein